MRLIDADALKEYFKTIQKYHVGEYSEWYLADVLEQQPTVDAVPAIRCKDCRYYDYGENPSETWSVCTAHINCYIETCADNFCSWAERKDIRTFTAEEWEFYKLV